MKLIQISSSQVKWGEEIFLCGVGKTGFIAENHKQEGDGKTPCGKYEFLKVYYRPDRVDVPQTVLPTYAIHKDSAWCDDRNHFLYNKYFDLNTLSASNIKSFENLWREDHLYDILMVVNHNYEPAVPNMGSAIFIHCTHKEESPPYKPSLGCLKLDIVNLESILKQADKQSVWEIPISLSF
jgi:L,D-peptidoglycan transpeptidase YkuD (ErfK/YbiS/YcfS/YnhG family)